MKLFTETIITGDKLFVLKEETFPYNDFPLHIHPEYELILVLKSSGKRYVGDNIDTFSSGDLCLFGPHLPHTFYNKHLPDNRDVHQVVIQFNEDMFGAGFFDKPQFSAIKGLFERSLHGICFKGTVRDKVTQKIKEMLTADEAESAANLISILNLLGRSSEYELLSHYDYKSHAIHRDTERMSRVYHYLLDNFKRDIPLGEIASIANLSEEAFCRYFKKHTRKTHSEFMNELRISYACRLLQQKHLSILDVCFESGYKNISYFNRQFKLQMETSPLQYQKRKFPDEISTR
jgi:AraC-like DNA-binding protein